MLAFNALHKSITKFWEIEEIQNRKVLSEEEFEIEEHFRKTTNRYPETGRYYPETGGTPVLYIRTEIREESRIKMRIRGEHARIY